MKLKRIIDAILGHIGTALRLWLALVLLLAAACYLGGPRDASLVDLLEAYGASGCGLMPPGFWKVLGILLLAALAFVPRGLAALWNLVLCAAVLVALPWVVSMAFGPNLPLPAPLDSCRTAIDFMQLPDSHGALVALGLAALMTGLFCAGNSVRTIITALVSYGLWFLCANLLWAMMSREMPQDAMLYDVSRSVQFHPWVCALLPGVFFGVFALLTCPLYAYSGRTGKDEDKVKDKAPAENEKPVENVAAADVAEEKELPKPEEQPQPTILEAEVVEESPAALPKP